LEHRRQTGQGQHIDLALFDVAVASMANQALNYLATGTAPSRMGNAHPNIVPYQAFSTKDGYIVLAVGNDQQFSRFCALADVPEKAQDSRFATNDMRVRHRQETLEWLEPIMAQKTTDEWLEILGKNGVPAGPVNDFARVFDEPQALHRNLKRQTPEKDGFSHPMVTNPIRMSQTPLEPVSPAPRLGADTNDVLRGVLGYDDAQMNRLVKAGVIEIR